MIVANRHTHTHTHQLTNKEILQMASACQRANLKQNFSSDLVVTERSQSEGKINARPLVELSGQVEVQRTIQE